MVILYKLLQHIFLREMAGSFPRQFSKFFSQSLKMCWGRLNESLTSIRDRTVRRDGDLGITPCWDGLSVSLLLHIKSVKTYWLNHPWVPWLAGFYTERALMLIIMGRQSLPSGQAKRNMVGSLKWWIVTFTSAPIFQFIILLLTELSPYLVICK